MIMQIKPRLNVDDYVNGVLEGNRIVLGQAITLAESTLSKDEELTGNVVERILHKTGNSIRIGLTGVPGVGKSTFIETFGKHIVDQGHKLAVLTVDPSSPLTKGSILGDKTRMEELSRNPNAFIRPSAAGNTLGGVASRTREALLLCEAAGYDVIVIETVGVGQSEVAVKNMVDFFLLLVLAGAGDELQGIKKGIMEMADALVVTKADGDNLRKATEAQAEYRHALHLSAGSATGWTREVLTSSAVTGAGMDDIWKMILKFQSTMTTNGFIEMNRRQQNAAWFNEYFYQLLRADVQKFPELITRQKELEHATASSQVSASKAAHQLVKFYHEAIRGNKS